LTEKGNINGQGIKGPAKTNKLKLTKNENNLDDVSWIEENLNTNLADLYKR